MYRVTYVCLEEAHNIVTDIVRDLMVDAGKSNSSYISCGFILVRPHCTYRRREAYHRRLIGTRPLMTILSSASSVCACSIIAMSCRSIRSAILPG